MTFQDLPIMLLWMKVEAYKTLFDHYPDVCVFGDFYLSGDYDKSIVVSNAPLMIEQNKSGSLTVFHDNAWREVTPVTMTMKTVVFL